MAICPALTLLFAVSTIVQIEQQLWILDASPSYRLYGVPK